MGGEESTIEHGQARTGPGRELLEVGHDVELAATDSLSQFAVTIQDRDQAATLKGF